jgi:ectoine hydroxylase-related dioxygenase (phytanoyl-CoA dioxygenase family)
MRTFTAAELQHCVDTIAADGVAIIHDAIDRAMLIEVRAELARLQELRPGGDIPPAPFTGFVTRRWLDLLNDGEVWQRVAIHPAILGVMPKVLGDGFLLSTMATALIGPGEHAQPFHVDDSVYLFPRPHPNLVCNTMWAISDFTAQNGCTRFARGSNKWSHDPVAGAVYEYEMLEMPAGSLSFVVGTCYHAGGHNRSDQDRIGLTINYCCGSMRQQENLMLGIHPERMMT